MLKIKLFTICYNEEIILPFFLDYYTKFVDSIVVYDNYSTDNSCEIINSFPQTKIIKYNTEGKLRDDRYLDIKNNCWKDVLNYDLVIVCDADEILWHEHLIDYLEYGVRKGVTIWRPHGYDMYSEALPVVQDGLITAQIRQGKRAVQMDKAIIFNPKKLYSIGYTPGCHNCNPKGEIKWGINYGELKLLHYRYINREYITNKYSSYRERLSEENKKNNWGFHYNHDREIIDRIFDNLREESQETVC